jgi:hypothetical protein
VTRKIDIIGSMARRLHSDPLYSHDHKYHWNIGDLFWFDLKSEIGPQMPMMLIGEPVRSLYGFPVKLNNQNRYGVDLILVKDTYDGKNEANK